MKKIITNDNSTTFFNEEYQETYHSRSGAEEEAIEKFVKPCRIKELAKNKEISILDICFGLGYNTAAAIDEINKTNKDCRINIIALENDIEILKKILQINSNFKSYNIIKELINEYFKKENNQQYLNQIKNNINFTLLLGDARTTIKSIKTDVDAVFLDPFSPKKCPELWTEEFFINIKKLMKNHAILATYSCARSVRDNLKKAGLRVKDGPIVGRRAPSTIAVR